MMCSTVKAVKYLFKSIYKGHDNVAFKAATETSAGDVDEITISQDIVVYGNKGSSSRVGFYRVYYNPLQYVLLFPFGEAGWHQGILTTNGFGDVNPGSQTAPNIASIRNDIHQTFKKAATLHGLSEASESLRIRLKECCNYQMPQSLRRLFSTILVNCNPVNGRLLWEEFYGSLSEDYAHLNGSNPMLAMNMALVDIGRQMDSMGKNINDYCLVDHNIIINETEQQPKALMPAVPLLGRGSTADTTQSVLLEGMTLVGGINGGISDGKLSKAKRKLGM